MSKDNSEVRFIGYGSFRGAWLAEVWDDKAKKICFSENPESNDKDDALDLACQMAAHLEEQADKDADYADELEAALATDRGVT